MTPSPWKRNPDGSVMGDEDGKAVTEAMFEMQRSVAEQVFANYQESGDWLLAAIGYGEGPQWGEAICRRYGLLDLPDAPDIQQPGRLSRPSGLADKQNPYSSD